MSEFSHLKNKLLAEQVEDQIYHYILEDVYKRQLTHGAPGGLRAAKAVQRLHKGGGAALAHSTPRLDVEIKVFIDAKAGQHLSLIHI